MPNCIKSVKILKISRKKRKKSMISETLLERNFRILWNAFKRPKSSPRKNRWTRSGILFYQGLHKKVIRHPKSYRSKLKNIKIEKTESNSDITRSPICHKSLNKEKQKKNGKPFSNKTRPSPKQKKKEKQRIANQVFPAQKKKQVNHHNRTVTEK